MDYVIPKTNSPTLTDLNSAAIRKLYELTESLDAKSDPDMVRAVVESTAKLNSSVKNSDILPKQESDEERQQREATSVLEAEING